MSDQFPSHSDVLAQHLRYHDRPDRGEWRVFCSCESRKWFTEAIEVISDETYIAHVERRWREACTVTTVEQLDALPVETVLRDASGQIFEKSPDGEGDTPWWYDGDPHYITDITLPARVIHNPDWETK